jgi:hypothetical protein
VLDVDDEVALVEIPERGGKGVLLARLARPLAHAPPEDLLVRDHREAGIPVHEPARDLAREQVGMDRGVVELHGRGERSRVGTRVLMAILEEAAEAVGRGGGPARHHRRDPAPAPLLESPRERRERSLLTVGALDLAAQAGDLDEREADRLGGAEPDAVARHGGPRCEQREGRRGRKEVGLGWQRELLAPERGRVLAGELRVELLERLLDAGRIVQVRNHPGRQVVEEGREAAGVEAGEERLHAEERRPLIDLIERFPHPRGGPVHPLGRIADGRLRRLLPLRREERLAGGAEEDLRHLALAPLRLRVEGATALHLVPEELEPDRRRVGRAPQVHDPPAHRERARVLHQRHAREAEQHELLGERLASDLHAGAEEVRARLEHPPRHLPPGEPARRDDGDRAPLRREMEPRQRGEPLELDAAVRGEVVVGKDRVGGEAQHRLRADEEGDVARELVRLVLVGSDGEHRPGAPFARREQLGDEPAARRAGEAGHVGAIAVSEGAADARPGGGGRDLGSGGHRRARAGGIL